MRTVSQGLPYERRSRAYTAVGIQKNLGGASAMKQHKFWAYAMVVCAIMAVYTGRKHA